MNNMTKELKKLEEGPEAEIDIDLLKTKLKKLSNWKTPGHDGVHGFWLKHIHLHLRQVSTRNERMPTKRTLTQMDDQRKDHIDPKGPKQRNSPE